MSSQPSPLPAKQKSDLDGSPWVQQAKDHWKQYNPKMYRDLEKKGLLHDRAVRAAEQTQDDLISMVRNGYDHDTAWQEVRHRYLFPPSEEQTERQSQEQSQLGIGQETTTESPTPIKSASAEKRPSTEPTSPPLEPSSS